MSFLGKDNPWAVGNNRIYSEGKLVGFITTDKEIYRGDEKFCRKFGRYDMFGNVYDAKGNIIGKVDGTMYSCNIYAPDGGLFGCANNQKEAKYANGNLLVTCDKQNAVGLAAAVMLLFDIKTREQYEKEQKLLYGELVDKPTSNKTNSYSEEEYTTNVVTRKSIFCLLLVISFFVVAIISKFSSNTAGYDASLPIWVGAIIIFVIALIVLNGLVKESLPYERKGGIFGVFIHFFEMIFWGLFLLEIGYLLLFALGGLLIVGGFEKNAFWFGLIIDIAWLVIAYRLNLRKHKRNTAIQITFCQFAIGNMLIILIIMIVAYFFFGGKNEKNST